MQCPACNNSLSHTLVDNIEVDTCSNGCGGIWFDTFEFKKFDEPHEAAGTALLDIPVDPSIEIAHEARRPCPRCDGVTLMRHFHSVKKQVEIDSCASCAGVWLDAGELNNIRNQFASEDEKRTAAQAAFDDLFDSQLEALAQTSEERVLKARRFANMVKFICPSYHIKGDQDWGAY